MNWIFLGKQLLFNEMLDKKFLANKLNEKICDPCNGKECYQLIQRKKNRKSVKQSEIITYQPKTFKNPNIIDIRSVIAEHVKMLHKLSKIVRQAEK